MIGEGRCIVRWGGGGEGRLGVGGKWNGMKV